MRPPIVPAPERVDDPGAGLGPLWLDEYLAAGLADLVRIRRRVHAHPELGHRESATTALIMRTLDADGIKARLYARRAPGSSPRSGPVSGWSACGRTSTRCPSPEATGLPFSSTLPDVSHACGHDLHLTVLLGAARALQRAGDLGGRVRLIFQPAEEVFPGGSHDVIAAGGLDGLTRLFALHCDPRLEVGLVGLKAGAITSTSDRGGAAHLRTRRPHLAPAPDHRPGVRAGHGDHRAARAADPAAGPAGGGRAGVGRGAVRRGRERDPAGGGAARHAADDGPAVLGRRRTAGAGSGRGTAGADSAPGSNSTTSAGCRR